jgi:hypothetical protein
MYTISIPIPVHGLIVSHFRHSADKLVRSSAFGVAERGVDAGYGFLFEVEEVGFQGGVEGGRVDGGIVRGGLEEDGEEDGGFRE